MYFAGNDLAEAVRKFREAGNSCESAVKELYFEKGKIDKEYAHGNYSFNFITEQELAEEYFEDIINPKLSLQFISNKWGIYINVKNCGKLWETTKKLPKMKAAKLALLLCSEHSSRRVSADIDCLANQIKYGVTPKQREVFYKILDSLNLHKEVDELKQATTVKQPISGRQLIIESMLKTPKKITGTRLAGVLDKGSFNKSPFSMWCEITNVYTDMPSGPQLEAGKTIEPILYKYIKDNFDPNILSPKDVYGEDYMITTNRDFFPDNEIFGGMWDFISKSNGEINKVYEMKTTSVNHRADWENGNIPNGYDIQAALYAYLLGVDTVELVVGFLHTCHYISPESFVPTVDSTLRISFSIKERFPDFEENYIKMAQNWWDEYVVSGISPCFTNKDVKILKAMSQNDIFINESVINQLQEEIHTSLVESIQNNPEYSNEEKKRRIEISQFPFITYGKLLLTDSHDPVNTTRIAFGYDAELNLFELCFIHFPKGRWRFKIRKNGSYNATPFLIQDKLFKHDGVCYFIPKDVALGIHALLSLGVTSWSFDEEYIQLISGWNNNLHQEEFNAIMSLKNLTSIDLQND